ncbi:hypothetical protein BC477_14195 [Clavibacter michiganensis subsp. michiganensis]|uniref:Uncharacterized protein n=1 Tax=Clavibacter michiganensis subsp. michiganensis TaxID=33013 RepID=A0A251XFI2_CLAMM|nr:hypothetical protein BC477_14195 [Clavibacter michiganensis subsp. michiganensis]OUE00759.1 hypothetical protein CMMCAS07_16855 [Clavibacter michiganensis subsp. michiganensis]
MPGASRERASPPQRPGPARARREQAPRRRRPPRWRDHGVLGGLLGRRLRLRCVGGLLRGRVAATGAVADAHQHGAHLDGLVLLDEDLLDHAGDRRGDLGVDLVGRHLEQGLVDLDVVADVLEPTGHRALGDALAECGEVDGFAHGVVSFRPDSGPGLYVGDGRVLQGVQRRSGESQVRLAERLVLGGVGVHQVGDVLGVGLQFTMSWPSPMSSPTRAPIMWMPTTGPSCTRTTLMEPAVPRMELLPLPPRLYS